MKQSNIQCEQCNKAFYTSPSRIGRKKFCSKQCLRVSKKKKMKEITCRSCGKVFDCPDMLSRSNAKFCSYKCKGYHRGREKLIGKKRTNGEGYETIFLPMHPFTNRGYMLYHRFLVEQYLRTFNPHSNFLIQLGDNCYLSPDLVVHHIDTVKTNNWLSNLYVCSSPEHIKIHHLIRKCEHIDIKPNFIV